MSPGVIADVNNAAELGQGTEDVYVNGASNISNNFQMDGSDANNFGSGRAGNFLQQGGIPIPNPEPSRNLRSRPRSSMQAYGRDAGANVVRGHEIRLKRTARFGVRILVNFVWRGV